MTIEEIIDNRQKAEQEAINALIKAFNAMTEERNYYKDKVERIMDIPTTVGDSGTYVKDYERNPKPVPTDNKPIDIPTLQPTTAHTEKPIDVFDIKPAPSSADANWSTYGQGNTTGLDWMHRETTTKAQG